MRMVSQSSNRLKCRFIMYQLRQALSTLWWKTHHCIWKRPVSLSLSIHRKNSFWKKRWDEKPKECQPLMTSLAELSMMPLILRHTGQTEWLHRARKANNLPTMSSRVNLTSRWNLNRDSNQETWEEPFRSMNMSMIWYWSLTTTPEAILSGTISGSRTSGLANYTGSISSILWNQIHSIIMECDHWFSLKLKRRNREKAGFEVAEISVIIKTHRENLTDIITRWLGLSLLSMTQM